MANTQSIILLILIIVLGNFFTGVMVAGVDDITLDDVNPMSKMKDSLDYKIDKYKNHQQETGFIESISNIGNVALSLPVTILEVLLDLIIIMAIGFKTIPTILNIIFIAPLTFIAVLEYILPMIRGN